MRKLLILFLTTAAFSQACLASYRDCLVYVGNYTSLYPSDPSLNISVDGSRLILTYVATPTSSRTVYMASFIADDQNQRGSGGFTGSQYTASCSRENISIIRWGLAKGPITTVLSFNSNRNLNENDFSHGGGGWTTVYRKFSE